MFIAQDEHLLTYFDPDNFGSTATTRSLGCAVRLD